MSEFIAKRDLSPDDFRKFSRQYQNDVNACRSFIERTEREIKVNEKILERRRELLADTMARAKTHGVEIAD